MNRRAFPDRLVVTPFAVSGDWQLDRDFRYITHGMELVTVQCGFVTDFASVPKPARIFYESWGSYGYASVIHDWLYSGGRVGGRKLTRRQADQVFYEAMIDSGVPDLRAFVLWLAVRIGGWRTWRT